MTDIQKHIITKLFTGSFLMKFSHSAKRNYKLFSGNMVAERYVSSHTYKQLSHLVKINKGRYTLNLSKVRGERNNSWVKQQYLKSKKAK